MRPTFKVHESEMTDELLHNTPGVDWTKTGEYYFPVKRITRLREQYPDQVNQEPPQELVQRRGTPPRNRGVNWLAIAATAAAVAYLVLYAILS